ncbi:hypothetical protein IV203_028384 [Nitzschia inconspicua]|uniref:Uncharacterized protein n=1 Tax=Nitzschia inconspicua TaxID=303405 RepID=A0A9K3Q270_9STRA|nr:hypothetical protein IV203_028384 [Nitzschia inconspicua]
MAGIQKQRNLYDQGCCDAATVSTSDDWKHDTDSLVEEGINDEHHSTVGDHALFYENFNKSMAQRRYHSQLLLCMGISLALTLTSIFFGVVATSNGAGRQQAVAGNQNGKSSSMNLSDHTVRSVPFVNRHNVEYDGIKLFKNNTSGIETEMWDAYAKTTEPITEMSFTAGDLDYTKHVVLTNRPHAGYEYGTLVEETYPKFAESAVLIGMYEDGELWLPPNEELDSYGLDDLFTLKIDGAIITLYKNEVPLSRYESPFGPHVPLYAQIWLKEPSASLWAVATRTEKPKSRRRTLGNGTSNQRAELRGGRTEQNGSI